MKGTSTPSRRFPATFDELARIMVPHAIVEDADYDNTTELVGRLALIAKPTKGQRQYLDTLIQLVEAYDAEHNAIDTSDINPLDLIKSLLADHGMNASDLGRLLGNRELGSKILREERKLSKANIKRLADHFKLSSAAFMD
jgi:antitoxin component HigA of HigAB toxin-antitoxin module